LRISNENVEFLDEGVKKEKKLTACLRRVNRKLPCWNFCDTSQEEQRVRRCMKCEALITCVDKKGKSAPLR